MKRLVAIALVLQVVSLFALRSFAQELERSNEQQLENLADAEQSEPEDDSFLQQLEQFRKHPVNLNAADENELRELRLLSDLQIHSFISYRNLFGRLIDIYELQSVPLWDLATIRKLLPFITINDAVSIKEALGQRFRKGDHSLLIRISQTIERSKGFGKISPAYLGSPQRLFLRYRYNYKNLMQYGVVGDKDAGEQFFKGGQGKGFDFYSFHFFARKTGIVEALAVGDFTVNLGQGLIHWQSMAFRKSSAVAMTKRQSAVLRPYNSAGEFNFHRGAGATLRKGKIEATVFASRRRLNANFTTDTLHESFISSFLASGNNRTINEVQDKNRIKQTAFGTGIKYKTYRWHAALNGIYHHFSLPIKKADEPYNRYAVMGDRWYNFSLDYSYTLRNFHFFGEAAADLHLNKAFINGVLISADARVDLSFVHRSIHKAYQAINANAFTESTSPANETGLFAGISIRPLNGWRMDGYADIFRFPWLKYLVDAPAYGKDFLLQLTYTPNKQVEMYTRYRSETKQANDPGNVSVMNHLVAVPRQSWRTHVNYTLSKAFAVRNRVEFVWYDRKGNHSEKGFITFIDIMYNPGLKPYSAVLRLQYFESGGYNSRLYAYENDVLYSYSIPVFSDKGYRYYLSCNYNITKRLSSWLRVAQTISPDKESIGTGNDEIRGNKRTEVKIQVRYDF